MVDKYSPQGMGRKALGICVGPGGGDIVHGGLDGAGGRVGPDDPHHKYPVCTS